LNYIFDPVNFQQFHIFLTLSQFCSALGRIGIIDFNIGNTRAMESCIYITPWDSNSVSWTKPIINFTLFKCQWNMLHFPVFSNFSAVSHALHTCLGRPFTYLGSFHCKPQCQMSGIRHFFFKVCCQTIGWNHIKSYARTNNNFCRFCFCV